MRLKIICCEVLYREMCWLVAQAPHTTDIEFLPKGLHDLGVEKMRPRLQERIDAADDPKYDAILLGYGLCNNGIAGLTVKNVRLVIPKAHDCITLFMGDRARYKDYFEKHPGTYYRTTGWLEHADESSAGEETVSQKLGLFLQYEELVGKYGEDNARYIMETMGNGVTHYDRLTFIRMGFPWEDRFQALAEKEAGEKGWTFEKLEGSMDLLRKLVWGEWDDAFIIVEPGRTVKATYGPDVICPE